MSLGGRGPEQGSSTDLVVEEEQAVGGQAQDLRVGAEASDVDAATLPPVIL